MGVPRGGHWPVRVEVSGDGGSIWYECLHEKMSDRCFHAWRLWEIDLPVDAEGWVEFCVRCWDNALNTQPTFVRSAWYVTFVFASVFLLRWSFSVMRRLTSTGTGICTSRPPATASKSTASIARGPRASEVPRRARPVDYTHHHTL